MINLLSRYSFSFVIIILFQVLILNNLNLGGYINPYLYVLILLTLPVEIPNWLLITIGFLTGLLIDAFLNTIGMHAAASVFLCFARPSFLRYLAPRDGYDPGSLPIPSYFGMQWFLKYIALTVFIHHLFLFFVEAFSFENFFSTAWKAIISSIFTIIIIMIAQLFGIKRERNQ
jgi:rod shape-determining protein MreD